MLVPLAVADRGEEFCPAQPPLQAVPWEGLTQADERAAERYWWDNICCAGRIAKVSLFVSACIVAIPGLAVACTAVCAGTLGAGCLPCLIAGGAGTVATCDSALAGLRRLRDLGCFAPDP